MCVSADWHCRFAHLLRRLPNSAPSSAVVRCPPPLFETRTLGMESTLIVLFFSWYLNHIWHCYRSSIESHPLYCRISLGQSIKQKDQDEGLERLASYRAIQCPQRRFLISYRVPYKENELRPRQWLNPNRKRALDDVGGAIRTRRRRDALAALLRWRGSGTGFASYAGGRGSGRWWSSSS